MKKRIANSVWLIALLMLVASAAVAQSASGVVNATLINKSGIEITFDTNASGVVLGGSGSPAATLAFGNISAFQPVGAGITRTTTVNTFTVSSPFNVFVTVGGVNSPSYRLQARLAAAAGVYTYKVDAITLTTANQNIVAADTHYDQDVQHTLFLTVPFTAPAGAVSNTVNFTVTAN